MIRDLEHQTPSRDLYPDVCIVGAGAAGITLALELLRRGRSVVLLEGGGRLVEEASQRPYAGRAEALPHRGLHEGRIRALGGTTTKWGGQILELNELDFAARPWIAGSGWPFAKRELTAAYERALAWEDVAGSMPADADVWAAVGEAVPSFPRLLAYVSRWCPEPNFARLHEAALERNPLLEVWLHANATEPILEDERVTGVRCRTQHGTEAVFHAREFCFCLGAIESSRFFLQPRAGGLPWNESGLLGRHFQDHIDCDAATIEPVDSPRFHAMFDAIFLGRYKYNPKLKLDEATQRTCGLLGAGATFYSVSDADETLASIKTTARNLMRARFGEIGPASALNLVRHTPTLLRQTYRYAVEHRAFHPAGAQLRMRVHCEQEPSSASAITLGDERDELGLLRTRLAWRVSPLEVHTIREFVRIASVALRDVATVAPAKALLAADDTAAIAHCEDSFHHMGGMRMHESPRCGVVSPDLQLHGTQNASVCSSAVFPSSGFSNPTHTLLALAVRLADRLAKT